MSIIQNAIGSFGKYQLWICCLIFMSKFGVAFHQLAIIILAPPAQYTCLDQKQTCCDNPVFNRSVFKRTIVMEWQLICERAWLKDFTQTLFQMGVMLGSLIFGITSDRFGRRRCLICAVILEVFTGLTSSFVPDYWTFTVIRMILGMAVGGLLVIGFVIVMELVGIENRYIVAAAYQMPFTIGHMLIPLFGYLIRDYMYFQVAISLTTTVLLFYICFLPESPRWLLAVNKNELGIQLLESIAKINGLSTHDIRRNVTVYQLENRTMNKKAANVLDLFRKSRLRRNILIMSFIWFACSCCFYGLSQYISYLSGDILINVMSSGGVCLIACFISIPVMKVLKRKASVVVSNTSCTLFLLITAFIPEGPVSVVFGCMGMLCSYVIFIVVYLYTTEMFPTVVRNAALGITSMTARLGAMLAPFIASLRPVGLWCAPTTFAILPLFATFLCIWLPETKDCELITSIEEGEEFLTVRILQNVENDTDIDNVEN